MPDSAPVRSAVDAAERAATAGDFSAAARHLRDALTLQERELGATHPDLASTLNNLGVICERIGEYAEAERCYRRACDIVTAAFPAEHPFVETSRHNLEAFCQARSLPLEGRPKFVPEPPPSPAPVPSPATAPRPPSRTAATPAATSSVEQKPGRFVLAPAVVAAVVIIGFVVWFNRSGARSSSSAPSPAPATLTPAAAPAPAPTPAAPPPASRESSTAAKVASPAPSIPPPIREAPRDGSPAVVDARLCRSLTRGAEWTCAPAADPVRPGDVYFYTRVTTARPTVIVHRWYRDDRVQLTRELQIEANVGTGYRTYSHLAVDAKSAGQWRVELRTPDGHVLREERFVVR